MNDTQDVGPAATVRYFPAAPTRGDLTVAEAIDAYMAGYSGRTPGIVTLLRFWRERIGHLRLRDVDADVVAVELDYLASTPALKARRDPVHGGRVFLPCGPKSPATLNRYRAALSAVMTWAMRKRLTPKGWQHPLRGGLVPAFPERNARVRFLSPDETKRLLAAARISVWPRLYLLILLALTTGARRGELLNLRWRSVDLQARVIRIETSKNGEPRTLVLTDAAVAELRRFAGAPDALVFPGKRDQTRPYVITEAWRRCLKNARIENFRFHDLRHCCASYLAQNGASLLEIAETLGHKTLAMVRRYSHLSIDSRRRIIESAFGRIA